MNSRLKKFLSYYKPYLGLFYADMACAIVVSITVLAIPLCIRYITKNLETKSPDVLNQIYVMGGTMLALIAIHTICHAFVDYKGHMMGALWKGTCAMNCLIITKSSLSSFMTIIEQATS